MYCRQFVLVLVLLLTTACNAVFPTFPGEGPPLILESARFSSSVGERESQRILTEAFNSISDLHARHVGRPRLTAYSPGRLSDDVLLHIESRGNAHFRGGRAQLYQLPYRTNEYGRAWLSLIKDSSNWVQSTANQQKGLPMGLVWQPIDRALSLRGAFGLSKTHANTVRTRLPAWKPVRHIAGEVHGFKYVPSLVTPPWPLDDPPMPILR